MLELLQERAWAFQETLLSKRLFTFGTLKTYWDFAEHRISSGRLEPEGSTLALFGYKLAEKAALSELDARKEWLLLAEQYCYRDMKFATDKLVVISAVASTFARLNHYVD